MDDERPDPKPPSVLTWAERAVLRERLAEEKEREAAERAEAATELELHDRPRIRADCENEPGPCPWVGCKYHLYLDVSPSTGALKFNFPDLEPWELEHSCALTLAERGGMTLTEVGKEMNVTRERVRQLESIAVRKLAEWKRELR